MKECEHCHKPTTSLVRGHCKTCYNRLRYYNKIDTTPTHQPTLDAAEKTLEYYSDILSKANAGMTYDEIGQSYGISRAAISNIINALAKSYTARARLNKV